jgi:GMP synthase (glutamine-hydrolysing)
MIKLKQNIYATQFHPTLDGEATALRIKVYKNAGYFKPEEADELIAATLKESVTEPAQILRRFTELYAKT